MTIVRSRVGWGLPAFAGAVVATLLAVAALHLTQGTAASSPPTKATAPEASTGMLIPNAATTTIAM